VSSDVQVQGCVVIVGSVVEFKNLVIKYSCHCVSGGEESTSLFMSNYVLSRGAQLRTYNCSQSVIFINVPFFPIFIYVKFTYGFFPT
jgi:hypothetical protein